MNVLQSADKVRAGEVAVTVTGIITQKKIGEEPWGDKSTQRRLQGGKMRS